MSVTYFTNTGAESTVTHDTPVNFQGDGIYTFDASGGITPNWTEVQGIEIKGTNSLLNQIPFITKIVVNYESNINDAAVGSTFTTANDGQGNPRLQTIDRDASGGLFRIELDTSHNSYSTEYILNLSVLSTD